MQVWGPQPRCPSQAALSSWDSQSGDCPSWLFLEVQGEIAELKANVP